MEILVNFPSTEVVKNPVIATTDKTDPPTMTKPTDSENSTVLGAAIGISVGIILIIGMALTALVVAIRIMLRQKKILRRNLMWV